MPDDKERVSANLRPSLRTRHRKRLVESQGVLAPSATTAVKLSGVSFDAPPIDELLEIEDTSVASLAPAADLAPSRGTGSARAGLILAIGDAVALAGAAALALAVRSTSGPGADAGAELACGGAFVVLGLALFAARGSYRADSHSLTTGWNDLRVIVPGVAVIGWLLVGLSALVGGRDHVVVGDGSVALVVLFAALAVPATRLASRTAQRRTRHLRRVIVVGSGMMARRVARSLAWDPCLKVLGLVDDDPHNSDSVLGGTDDLPALCTRLQVDQVVVAFSRTHPAEALERLRAVHCSVDVAVVPRYFELLSPRSNLRELGGIPLVDLAPPQLGPAARTAKRLFDVVVSALVLVGVAPLMAVITLLIKLTSEGTVLFRQERTGYHARPFVIYKFRTMTSRSQDVPADLRAMSEVDGPLFKMREDPRTTAVGRFLRRTSLDELPQLFNVLKGEMSLVGPRPFIPSESAQMIGHALRRFEVRPGLTGLWQISGRSMLSYEEVIRLDYLYVASWSFWWDIKILLSTPAKVLRGVGAY